MTPNPSSSLTAAPPEPQWFMEAPLRMKQALNLPVPDSFVRWLGAANEMTQIWQTARCSAGSAVFGPLLSALQITARITPADIARIPSTGPALLVCNHPFGLLDGLIAGHILELRRADFRFLANSFLLDLPAIGSYILPVDVFATGALRNSKSLRRAIRWLDGGGALIVFPSGEVSSIQGVPPAIVDPPWSEHVVRLVTACKTRVIPMFLAGRNSIGFQCAGLVHPYLRTALLARELINKRGRTVNCTIGSPVAASRFAGVEPGTMVNYLRRRTYCLAERDSTRTKPAAQGRSSQIPIRAALEASRIRAEVEALPGQCLLFRKSSFAVYLARKEQIPNALVEIGRLREVTFRGVGEGTGRDIDLDRFDDEYLHLFLWHEEAREIAGAYRLVRADEAQEAGRCGLYTGTLFRLPLAFLQQVRNGIELGRSFVRPEYQRTLHPLYFLWKGIGAFLVRNPRYRYLFGAVSISGDYSLATRELLAHYFRARRPHGEAPVRPRHAFRPRAGARMIAEVAREVLDIDELSELVSDLEGGGKGVPVLLRHYLSLGAKILQLNVDRQFSNALDALIVVDLASCDRKALGKYIGPREAEALFAVHAGRQGVAEQARL